MISPQHLRRIRGLLLAGLTVLAVGAWLAMRTRAPESVKPPPPPTAPAMASPAEHVRDFPTPVRSLDATDLLALLQRSEAAEHDGMDDELRALLLEELIKSNPRLAAGYIAGLPAGPVRDAWLDRLVPAWLQANFPAALSWARNLPEDAMKARALVHLSYRWMEQDPVAVAEYALTQRKTNGQLLNTLASQWARRDPQAAVEWVANLPDELQRRRLFTSMVATWAESSPSAAALFAGNLAAEDGRDEAIITVVSGWAQRDPVAAAQWVASFLPGRLQEQAILQVVPALVERNPLEAAQWLGTLSNGPAGDVAIASFSSLMANRDPALAFSFAEGITADRLRLQRMEAAARRWLAADPVAARKGLETADLPLALRARLLALPGRSHAKPRRREARLTLRPPRQPNTPGPTFRRMTCIRSASAFRAQSKPFHPTCIATVRKKSPNVVFLS